MIGHNTEPLITAELTIFPNYLTSSANKFIIAHPKVNPPFIVVEFYLNIKFWSSVGLFSYFESVKKDIVISITPPHKKKKYIYI